MSSFLIGPPSKPAAQVGSRQSGGMQHQDYCPGVAPTTHSSYMQFYCEISHSADKKLSHAFSQNARQNGSHRPSKREKIKQRKNVRHFL